MPRRPSQYDAQRKRIETASRVLKTNDYSSPTQGGVASSQRRAVAQGVDAVCRGAMVDITVVDARIESNFERLRRLQSSALLVVYKVGCKRNIDWPSTVKQ